MRVRVIIPPEPVVTPGDIPGGHASDDAAVARSISAATRTIVGPEGWLGRSLGPQTLEASGWIGCRRFRLPCPPIIDIVSVETEDSDGNRETVPAETYRRDGDEIVIASGAAWVTCACHHIRYEAGYNGTPVVDGGTGDIPPEAIEAIILLVQDQIRTGSLDGDVRSEAVEGVGSATYLDADKFSLLATTAAQRLLDGLRLYA